MVVVMQERATEQQIDSVIARLFERIIDEARSLERRIHEGEGK